MKGDETEALRARLDDLARRAGRLWTPLCSRFLTQEERSLAQRCARENGVLTAFDGGWEGAERSQCCFYPDGLEPDFTGVWLEVSWNAKFASVDHRALLGSVMALGMDRSLLGDMVIEGDHAYIRAVPELAARLPQELTRVGSATVKVRERSEPPAITPPKGTELRDTVASLRLDSVLSSGMKTSRAKATEWIRQGAVQVNHTTTERIDQQIKADDLISVRGFGRIILREIGTPTRKERIPILLEVFGKH